MLYVVLSAASWDAEDSSDYTTTDSDMQNEEVSRKQRKRKAAEAGLGEYSLRK